MSGFIEVNRLFSVDLYDTTMDYQDVRISDELIKSQLMWPNMSLDQTDSSEGKEKYVNPKVSDKFVTQFYFWRQGTFETISFWIYTSEYVNQKRELLKKLCLSTPSPPHEITGKQLGYFENQFLIYDA